MAFTARFFIYILGGGALLAWVRPSRGLWEIVAVLAWIGLCAAADTLVTGAAGGPRAESAHARRNKSASTAIRSFKRTDSQDSGKRRGLNVLYASGSMDEAESLSAQLRERGLHPMVVSQRSSASSDAWVFEVRVPESEWRRAMPILTRFSAKRAGS